MRKSRAITFTLLLVFIAGCISQASVPDIDAPALTTTATIAVPDELSVVVTEEADDLSPTVEPTEEMMQDDLTPTVEPTEAPLAPVLHQDDITIPSEPNYYYNQEFRPQFHLSAREGWLGDPDGMVRYNGIYHVFWWGHAVSRDLVHWQQLPSPMVGDDGSFVYFTGSVVVDSQNTGGFARRDTPPMVAIYTMHDRASGEETQGLSISQDHQIFTFYDRNPVLDSEEAAFRDPAVFFHEPTQRWITAITLPERRKISFYASTDLKQWQHLSDFGPIGARSQLWEVPDLFQMQVDRDPNRTVWVLMCGMGPNKVQYFVGDFDGSQFTLDPAANGYLLRGEGIPGDVFADFEEGLPDGWNVDGTEVAVGPIGKQGLYKVSGLLGSGFLSTYTPEAESGDRGVVTVTSESFVIQKNAINFLLAGGSHDGDTVVNLLVDGEVVRTAAGDNTVQMKWVGWDVAELKGATAQIQIVDDYTASNVGHIDIDQIIFSDGQMETGREHAQWLDYGPDYYAVRTYRDYDNADDRTITMGWMGNWEYANDVPTGWGKGALALPRVLELRSYEGGVRLIQQPIADVEQLRQAEVHLENIVVGQGTIPLAEFAPKRNTYEIDATFTIDDPTARFGLRLAARNDTSVQVGFDAKTSTLFLDRTNMENSDFSRHFPKLATAPLTPRDGTVRLRIFVDQSSIEVFANEGERTMTALIFPDHGSRGIEVFAERGHVVMSSLRAWELKSIWGIEP